MSVSFPPDSDTSATARDDWAVYRERLRRFLVTRIRDPQAAEDLVQDVMVRALDGLDRHPPRGALLPWLFGITRNVLADYYRNARTSTTTEADIPDPDPPDPTAEGEALSGLATCVTPFLSRLSDADRQLVEWHDREGLSGPEIAGRLGISLSAAKSRILRARRRLRDHFVRCCRIALDARNTPVAAERRAGDGHCTTCG